MNDEQTSTTASGDRRLQNQVFTASRAVGSQEGPQEGVERVTRFSVTVSYCKRNKENVYIQCLLCPNSRSWHKMSRWR